MISHCIHSWKCNNFTVRHLKRLFLKSPWACHHIAATPILSSHFITMCLENKEGKLRGDREWDERSWVGVPVFYDIILPVKAHCWWFHIGGKWFINHIAALWQIPQRLLFAWTRLSSRPGCHNLLRENYVKLDRFRRGRSVDLCLSWLCRHHSWEVYTWPDHMTSCVYLSGIMISPTGRRL